MPSSRPLDVVIVPDFSGRASLLFEARTLFFLASWQRVYGNRSAGPQAPRLQICSIGEPPDSVARLAAAAGAGLECHQPIREAGLINKLRGLEVRHRGGRLLLLDVDTLVLRDLAPVVDLEADLAAAVAGKAQVPEAAWREIYAAFGIPLPAERLVSVFTRSGLDTSAIACRRATLDDESRAMLPYYNSGAVLVTAGCPLAETWRGMHERLQAFLATSASWRDHHVLASNDQPSFALATVALQMRGFTFGLLPETCNARLPHFSGGLLRFDDVMVFHATGFAAELLQPGRARSDLPDLVDSYARRWSAAFHARATSIPSRWRAFRDGRRATRLLTTLWRTIVHDAWQSG
ncbi:MAG: hypothetical protein ACKO4T_03250 [Planctomycetaceae bacterium]